MPQKEMKESPPNAGLMDAKSVAVALVSALGAALSAYLLVMHFLPAERSSLLFRICSVGAFNCDRVNSSPWASFLGFPLAAWGIAFYAIAAFVLVLRGVAGEDAKKALGAFFLWMTGAGAAAVLPLLAISAFLIRAFCLFCVIAWACNIALFVIAFLIIGPDGRTFAFHREALCFFLDSGRNFRPVLALVLSCVLVFLTVIFASASLRHRREAYACLEAAKMEQETMDEYLMQRPIRMDLTGTPVYYGDPRAKVAMVEYFNFDCGVCRAASPIIKKIIDRYPGKVKLYLRHYPLDAVCNRHVREKGDGLSCKASLIAMALEKSASYGTYVDHILGERRSLGRGSILDAMEKAGIDVEALRRLMGEKTAMKRLESHIDSGEKLGIQGTPSFIIQGKPLPSGLPPARFLDRIIKIEVDKAYGGP